MKWQYCDLQGKPSKNPTDYQLDNVGNILQVTGAVIPKACQKCKKPFDAQVKLKNVTQPVRYFTCQCNFQTGDANEALIHKMENETHKLKIDHKDRIVKTERTLVGRKSHVKEVKKLDEVTDIKILCDDCV